MRVALAQINSFLGDFEGNARKIVDFAKRAHQEKCDLVVFPEAALFGYHPADLLERPSIVRDQEKQIRKIHSRLPAGIGILIGAFVTNTSKKGKGFWNAAVFLCKGKKLKVFPKELLPTYDVFDESRHVEPGDVRKNILTFKGKRIMVTVCEDIWGWPRKDNPFFSRYGHNPLRDVKPKKMDLVVNLSASPFTHTKLEGRRVVTKCTAEHFGAPMVYVNMVGAQDELIYDGGSFAIDKKGRLLTQCSRFEEELGVVDLEKMEGERRGLTNDPVENVCRALTLGIRDFAQKTGFSRAHLGLSGGIDSALVACLAAEALGPENVTAIMLPGPFTSEDSTRWSKELARKLGLAIKEVPIIAGYESLLKSFEHEFGTEEFGLVNENLQARIRGVVLMAFSNRYGSLLLGTSNKSELAVGYSTIYGDMIGGLMPIGDLLKTEVYGLAMHFQRVIPSGIISRPPSAELRANQTDQDSLPPYDELDEVVKHLVVGFDAPKSELEHKVLDMMLRSEFKRWQAPPILKVSEHAFGRGRRFPVAHGARG